MFSVYIGLISDLNLMSEQVLQNETKIHEFAQTIGQFRRTTLFAGRTLLKLALVEHNLLQSEQLLPPIENMEHGKPFIPSLSCSFNISHAGSYIALSLGDFEQGIDLEQVRERKSFQALIKRVLSNDEYDYLTLLPESEQLKLFIKWWTIKETLIKESGLGLVGIDQLKIDPYSYKITAPDNPQGVVYTLSLNELYTKLDLYKLLSSEIKEKCLELFLSVFTQDCLPQLNVLTPQTDALKSQWIKVSSQIIENIDLIKHEVNYS